MRRELLLIEQLIEAAEQARQLVAGIELADLETDRQRRDALLWNFTVLGEIVTAARSSRDRHTELLGRRLRLVALLEGGDLAGVESEISLFARTAQELRQPVHLWYVPLWRAAAAAARGRFDEAFALAAEARAVGALGHSANAEILTFMTELFALRDAGELSASSRLIARMLPLAQAAELGVLVSGALALDHLGAGRSEAATVILDRVADQLPGLPRDSEWLPLLVQCAEAAWELGVTRWRPGSTPSCGPSPRPGWWRGSAPTPTAPRPGTSRCSRACWGVPLTRHSTSTSRWPPTRPPARTCWSPGRCATAGWPSATAPACSPPARPTRPSGSPRGSPNWTRCSAPSRSRSLLIP